MNSSEWDDTLSTESNPQDDLVTCVMVQIICVWQHIKGDSKTCLSNSVWLCDNTSCETQASYFHACDKAWSLDFNSKERGERKGCRFSERERNWLIDFKSIIIYTCVMRPNTTKWNTWHKRQQQNGFLIRDDHKKFTTPKSQRYWPIGKHKGQMVNSLEKSYLSWVIKNITPNTYPHRLAQWELWRRSKSSK